MQGRLLSALAALAAAGASAAQNPARPDPAEPKRATTARPAYESAFRDYRPYADPDVGRWRESNEEMGRLRGHAGHVPGSVPPAARGTDAPAKPATHGSHK
jgi:hypothetical protein